MNNIALSDNFLLGFQVNLKHHVLPVMFLPSKLYIIIRSGTLDMGNKSCLNFKPLRSWIMLLTILLVTSTTLIPLGFGLNQNQIANAQQLQGVHNNLTSSSSLAKQQQPNGYIFSDG